MLTLISLAIGSSCNQDKTEPEMNTNEYRLIEMVYPDSSVWTYSYTENDQISKITNTYGMEFEHIYEPDGRFKMIIFNPENYVETYHYIDTTLAYITFNMYNCDTAYVVFNEQSQIDQIIETFRDSDERITKNYKYGSDGFLLKYTFIDSLDADQVIMDTTIYHWEPNGNILGYNRVRYSKNIETMFKSSEINAQFEHDSYINYMKTTRTPYYYYLYHYYLSDHLSNYVSTNNVSKISYSSDTIRNEYTFTTLEHDGVLPTKIQAYDGVYTLTYEKVE